MDNPLVPWARVADFLRQHTHDVRNELNCLDLECAQLQDIVPAGEAQHSVDSIKKVSRTLAQRMRELSGRFQACRPIAGPVPASALLTIWREKHAAIPKVPEAVWSNDSGAVNVVVDVELMAAVFRELLINAMTFDSQPPLTISCVRQNATLTFELKERKTKPVDTTGWGEPFFSTLRGRYGLGLWTVRRYVEANQGRFQQRFDPASAVLTSSIALPVAG